MEDVPLSREELEEKLVLAEQRIRGMATLQERLKRERAHRYNVTQVCGVLLKAIDSMEGARRSVQDAIATLPATIDDSSFMRQFMYKFQEEFSITLLQGGLEVRDQQAVRRDQRLVVRLGLYSHGEATMSTDALSVMNVNFETLRGILKDLGVSDAPLLKFKCTAMCYPFLALTTRQQPLWLLGGSPSNEMTIQEAKDMPIQSCIDSHARPDAYSKGVRHTTYTVTATLDVSVAKWAEAMVRLGCSDLSLPTATSPRYVLVSRTHKKPKL
jgi:hypothetical protein